MTPERYEKICDLFAAAQGLPPEQREGFLATECGEDEDLRLEVESLLASDESSGDFIESPALEMAAELLVEEKSTSKIGSKFGQYKILELIGAGGMGEVWLADDTKLKRRVALKLLAGVQNQDRLLRFQQEAFAVSALNHPNIITIFDIGDFNGQQFIATEIIEGKTLRQVIQEEGLSVSRAVDIASQVCAALSTAHSAGIIHRDIKPENIMVRSDGIVKVLDFGLAKLQGEEWGMGSKEKEKTLHSSLPTPPLTNPGMVMGTVNYMSPEQARGLPVDEKTDVFSFGIVLYEMLGGELPFKGNNEIETLAAILDRDPKPLYQTLPEDLRNLAVKSLNKNSLERPKAAEIVEKLRFVKRDLDLITVFRQQKTTGNLEDEKTIEMNALTEQNARAGGIIQTQKNSNKAFLFGVFGILIAAAIGIFAYSQFWANGNQPILKEADKFLLADFENKTGDEEFDKILRQPLAVSLEQSPFLTLVPDGQIRQTLQQMEKKADEPLTYETAREIAQRRGIKAFMRGRIETRGVEYLITLETFSTETGESIAREEVESKNKETVMGSLGDAASRMREKLGESLASIKRLDAPLQESTTNSLEALKSYTIGSQAVSEGKNDDAVKHFERAIELDPNFFAAYISLAVAYNNKGQISQAQKFVEKAYTLRDRATVRQRLKVTDNYHAFITGDAEKNIETLELYRQTYPRDIVGAVNLGAVHTQIGKFNKSEEYARIAMTLDPTNAIPYLNLGKALNLQSRYDEAKAVFEEALTRKIENPQIHRGLFTVAFAKGDEAEMQRQLELLKKQEEDSALILSGNPLIFSGKWRDYQKVLNQTITTIEKDLPDVAADYASQAAVNSAAVGKCKEAVEYQNRALKYEKGQAVMQDAALTFALCRGESEKIIAELKEKYPQNTVVNKMWLPIANAALALKNSPEKTLEFLETTRPYEGGTYFWDNYLRGQAYVKLKKNELAIAEFQKIIQNRGWATHSPLFALAHKHLSEIYKLQNDEENSKKYAEQFAVLWKNADNDLPILNGNKPA